MKLMLLLSLGFSEKNKPVTAQKVHTKDQDDTEQVKMASTPICLVSSCLIGSLAICMAPVLSHKRGVGASQEVPKSASNHRSHTICVLEQDTQLVSWTSMQEKNQECNSL